jgi:hypothetical protein
VEANGLSKSRDHEHVVRVARKAHSDELVVFAKLDSDDPVRLERCVVRTELRLLDDSLPRCADEVLGFLEVPGSDDGSYVFVLAERQQVDDRPPLRLTRAEARAP